IDRLRARVREWKREGLRVGFVPTMGNLHAGHFSLVRLARAHADRVVASVFVNPTQFGPNEDLERYPRTPERDAEGLDAAGCDLLWMPSVETMYPYGAGQEVRIRVPGVTDVLEGAHRPGHFDGVATVVARLFNQVQPDVAAFGRKDYQQLAVIRYLLRDLALPVELLAGEPVREAMRAGTAPADVEARARAALGEDGFDVDYAVVRRPDLTEVGATVGPGTYVALVAARLGRTRLIDNLEFELG